MQLKNGVSNYKLSMNDLCMKSVKKDRIVFHFVGNIWDDILYEAMNLAISNIPLQPEQFYQNILYEDVVHGVDVYIGFNIQKKYIHIYCDLIVDIGSGEACKKRFPCYFKNECEVKSEVEHILESYFDKGCDGLFTDFANFFKKMYSSYKEYKN